MMNAKEQIEKNTTEYDDPLGGSVGYFGANAGGG